MRQPDLGLKVTELRVSKNITQEQLAEYCEVSTRTIQRIESGEVDPRTHTLGMLSTVLEFDFGQDQTQNENVWLTILHLSSAVCVLVIPLLIWSWKKPQSHKLDTQGRQVLNFQITMTLVLFSWMLLLILFPLVATLVGDAGWASLESGPFYAASIVVGTVPPILIGGFCLYQGVANAARALADNPVHYALSIQFVK